MKLGKVFIWLWIIQEVSNKGRKPHLGKGFSVARRVNPWNPLSYPFVIIMLILAILMFGFVGFRDEVDISNPFKWN